jgi:WD40 repeat protein
MLHRRQFIGTAAAVCVGIPLTRTHARSTLECSGGWNSRAIQTIAREGVHQPPVVTGVAIQPNGNWLAVVGDDHAVGLLDLQRMEFASHFTRHRDWVRAARFSPDGQFLATAGNDARLLIWDMRQLGRVRELATHPQAIQGLDISPDGRRIATVGFENRVCVYRVDTGRRDWTAVGPCDDLCAVAYSPDGQKIAAGGRSGAIRIWDASGDIVHELPGHHHRVRSIEFTNDGEVIACGDDGAVRISNPQNPADDRSLPRRPGKIFAVKLISGNRIATGGSDDLIRIWDLGSTHEIDTLHGHVGTVSCLDAQGTMLVSGSYDTQIRVWTSEQNA